MAILPPNYTSIPVERFSYAISQPGAKKHPWIHDAKADLSLVFKNIRAPTDLGGYKNTVCMSIYTGTSIVEEHSIGNLEEAFAQYRSATKYGSNRNSSSEEPPVRIVVKSPMIAIRFPNPPGAPIKRIQMRFKSHDDYLRALNILSQYDLTIEDGSKPTAATCSVSSVAAVNEFERPPSSLSQFDSSSVLDQPAPLTPCAGKGNASGAGRAKTKTVIAKRPSSVLTNRASAAVTKISSLVAKKRSSSAPMNQDAILASTSLPVETPLLSFSSSGGRESGAFRQVSSSALMPQFGSSNTSPTRDDFNSSHSSQPRTSNVMQDVVRPPILPTMALSNSPITPDHTQAPVSKDSYKSMAQAPSSATDAINFMYDIETAFAEHHEAARNGQHQEIWERPGYINGTPEERQAIITDFICENLENEDFIRLCEDVNNTWVALGLGKPV